MTEITLILATVSMGLIAGLFYTFSISVMPGFRRISDSAFVESMNAINGAIQNLGFALSFFGALLFTSAALVLDITGGQAAIMPVTLALGLYVVALIITFGVNIPLNIELERALASGSRVSVATLRERFERRWTGWNAARMLLSAAAFVLLCTALPAGIG
ncbi:DUF1772 domain-containing protein [Arthrobacter sp. H5]|uniref:anthrone oxygenase family protein n=1 Tax=Arthrobacter sp. H5 TaxID=1267973 RepID=UPI0004B901FF|nr:DUF1772 domain-containing protein [Arthrobacter sp. H5]